MNVRDAIAPVIEEALAVVTVPADQVAWDVSYGLVPTPTGEIATQGMLVLLCPSPLLGAGSIITTGFCDLRQLADPDTALQAVRSLVENLRTARPEQLSITNGAGS